MNFTKLQEIFWDAEIHYWSFTRSIFFQQLLKSVEFFDLLVCFERMISYTEDLNLKALRLGIDNLFGAIANTVKNINVILEVTPLETVNEILDYVTDNTNTGKDDIPFYYLELNMKAFDYWLNIVLMALFRVIFPSYKNVSEEDNADIYFLMKDIIHNSIIEDFSLL